MPASDITLNASILFDTSKALKDVSSFAKRAEARLALLQINPKHFTEPLGRISKSAGEFEKSLAASNARVIAFGASAGVIWGVQRAFVALIKSTAQVERSLTEMNVILNVSSDRLARMRDSLFDIAKSTGQTFKQVAVAATELARQGLGVEETLRRTKDALILTRLSGLDVVSSVETLTAVMNSFNKTTITSTQLINKLANVDAAFAVSLADLSEGIKRVGSTAQDTGVKLDSMVALITAAKQITAREGAVIGNSFKTIFQRLQRPQTLNYLNDLGVAVTDLSGQVLAADKILLNLAQTYKSLDPLLQNQVVQLAAGVFQANVFRAILSDLSKEYSFYGNALKVANNATDQAIKRNEELNKTLSSMVNETLANLTQVGSKIGELSLEPFLKHALDTVNKYLLEPFNKLASGPFKGVLESVFKGLGHLAMPAVITGAVAFFKLLSTTGKFISESFKSFMGLNNILNQELQIQRAISTTLAQNPKLVDAVLNKKISLLAVEESILATLRAQASTQVGASAISIPLARNLSRRGAVLREGSLTYKQASRGYPNFSPVSEAIAREVDSGVPRSIVRVDSHPSLKSSINPQGYGVYNLRDEPGGLHQGINRANRMGLNPKTHGLNVPNFATLNYAQALQILKSKKFKSITYQKPDGAIADYNISQWRVRRDQLVGAPAPSGYKNWTDFDNKTNTLALWTQKENEQQLKFRRFRLDRIKKIRDTYEEHDVIDDGSGIPNFAFNVGQFPPRFGKPLASAIRKLKDSGLYLKDFDIPLSYGRSKGNVLGEYYAPGVYPQKIAYPPNIKLYSKSLTDDFPFKDFVAPQHTLYHEYGHFIDDLIGKSQLFKSYFSESLVSPATRAREAAADIFPGLVDLQSKGLKPNFGTLKAFPKAMSEKFLQFISEYNEGKFGSVDDILNKYRKFKYPEEKPSFIDLDKYFSDRKKIPNFANILGYHGTTMDFGKTIKSNRSFGEGQGQGFYAWRNKQAALHYVNPIDQQFFDSNVVAKRRKIIAGKFNEKYVIPDYEIHTKEALEFLKTNKNILNNLGVNSFIDREGTPIGQIGQAIADENGVSIISDFHGRKRVSRINYDTPEGDIRSGALLGPLFDGLRASNPSLVRNFELNLIKNNPNSAFRYIGPDVKAYTRNIGKKIPNFAYIPGITPLVGRLATNLIYPGSYSLMEQLGSLKGLKFKDIWNALAHDKMVPQISGRYGTGTSDEAATDLPFRQMFGLKPRFTKDHLGSPFYIQTGPKTYQFNPKSTVGQHHITKAAEYIKYDKDKKRFYQQGDHFVMGGFNMGLDPSKKAINYWDRWDFDPNPGEWDEFKAKVKKVFSNQKGLGFNLKKRWQNLQHSLENFDMEEFEWRGNLATPIRQVMSWMADPVTIKGQLKNTGLSSDVLSRSVLGHHKTLRQYYRLIEKSRTKSLLNKANNIPDFSLSSSIMGAMVREKASGVPSFAIRVGQDSRLVNSKNPVGLGVYNTQDEPAGLQQGINRANKLGLNPKTHGLNIPNFAFFPDGTEVSVKDIDRIAQGRDKKELLKLAQELEAKGVNVGLKPTDIQKAGVDRIAKRIKQSLIKYEFSNPITFKGTVKKYAPQTSLDLYKSQLAASGVASSEINIKEFTQKQRTIAQAGMEAQKAKGFWGFTWTEEGKQIRKFFKDEAEFYKGQGDFQREQAEIIKRQAQGYHYITQYTNEMGETVTQKLFQPGTRMLDINRERLFQSLHVQGFANPRVPLDHTRKTSMERTVSPEEHKQIQQLKRQQEIQKFKFSRLMAQKETIRKLELAANWGTNYIPMPLPSTGEKISSFGPKLSRFRQWYDEAAKNRYVQKMSKMLPGQEFYNRAGLPIALLSPMLGESIAGMFPGDTKMGRVGKAISGGLGESLMFGLLAGQMAGPFAKPVGGIALGLGVAKTAYSAYKEGKTDLPEYEATLKRQEHKLSGTNDRIQKLMEVTSKLQAIKGGEIEAKPKDILSFQREQLMLLRSFDDKTFGAGTQKKLESAITKGKIEDLTETFALLQNILQSSSNFEQLRYGILSFSEKGLGKNEEERDENIDALVRGFLNLRTRSGTMVSEEMLKAEKAGGENLFKTIITKRGQSTQQKLVDILSLADVPEQQVKRMFNTLMVAQTKSHGPETIERKGEEIRKHILDLPQTLKIENTYIKEQETAKKNLSKFGNDLTEFIKRINIFALDLDDAVLKRTMNLEHAQNLDEITGKGKLERIRSTLSDEDYLTRAGFIDQSSILRRAQVERLQAFSAPAKSLSVLGVDILDSLRDDKLKGTMSKAWVEKFNQNALKLRMLSKAIGTGAKTIDVKNYTTGQMDSIGFDLFGNKGTTIQNAQNRITEYTFSGTPVPEEVKDQIRVNGVHELRSIQKDLLEGSEYLDPKFKEKLKKDFEDIFLKLYEAEQTGGRIDADTKRKLDEFNAELQETIKTLQVQRKLNHEQNLADILAQGKLQRLEGVISPINLLEQRAFESVPLRYRGRTDEEALQVQRVIETAKEEEIKNLRHQLGPYQKASYGAGRMTSQEYAQQMVGVRNYQILNPEVVGAFKPIQDSFKSFVDQLRYTVKDLYTDFNEGAAEMGAGLKSEFKSSFKEFAHGLKSADDALRDFGINIATRILDKTIDIGIDSMTGALVSGFGMVFNRFTGSKGGYVKGYSSGGKVIGGSGQRDDVAARLTAGEYVLNKRATQKYGTKFLNKLNNGAVIGFANGGSASVLLRNKYNYDDPRYPTKGEMDVDPNLSNFALSDEENPQNIIRMERESDLYQYLHDRDVYEQQKNDAIKAWQDEKRQRRIAAYISTGIQLAGAGMSYGISKYQTSPSHIASLEAKAANGSVSANKQLGQIYAQKGDYHTASQYYNNANLIKQNPNLGSSYSRTYPGTASYSHPAYRATGGIIPNYVGFGSAGTDKIQARLTGGEFVINNRAVQKYGVPFFNKLNNQQIRTFETGGLNNLTSTNVTSTVNRNESTNKLNEILLKLITSNEQLKNSLDQKLGSNIDKILGNKNQTQQNNAPVQVHSTVNIHVQQGGEVKSSSNTTVNNSNQNNMESERKLGSLVEATVYKVIVDQQRPGGLLYRK